MLGSRLTYRESILILLEGTTAINYYKISQLTGAKIYFLKKLVANKQIPDEELEKITTYLWKNLNRHVILTEADYGISNR